MARTQGSASAEASLHDAMVAPSASPDVVVLDFVDEDSKYKEVADPKKDLWLSTVDGQVICAFVTSQHSRAMR
jgi:hypothetical protein